MASIVIVTKQCYLLCESINYIAVNEVQDDEDRDLSIFDRNKRKRKKPTKKQIEAWKKMQYQIIIDFIPSGGVNPGGSGSSRKLGNGETATVAIKVTGRDRCLELFAHMVEQIREQIPDNKFLDEIVEKFIQENKDDNQNV